MQIYTFFSEVPNILATFGEKELSKCIAVRNAAGDHSIAALRLTHGCGGRLPQHRRLAAQLRWGARDRGFRLLTKPSPPVNHSIAALRLTHGGAEGGRIPNAALRLTASGRLPHGRGVCYRDST